MSKVKYYYDADTLSYREITDKKTTRFKKAVLFLSASFLFGMIGLLFLLNTSIVNTPKELSLSSELKNLSFQFEQLNKKMDEATAVLADVENRDNTIYRVSFENATGTSNSDSIQTAFNEVDQASTNLQRQFGLSRRAADDISTAWFLGGEAGAKAGVTNGVLSANVGAKAGGTRTWTDSDIGIASEDRSRIFGSLAQMSDSRNWSSTRDGFVRSVSTSSSSSISSTASGMNASLTEAQSYSREARRAEELANRLESQASFFEGNSAAGSLNLSQTYREWGLVQIERNRDFYGNVRFDDLTFQLSPEGQALQGKFIESYAEQLRDGIEDRLVLTPGQPISRPSVSGLGSVRGRAQIGGGGSGSVPQVDQGTIHDEVLRAQDAGRQRIRGSRSRLDTVTRGAQGASAESADEVKEW